MPVRPGTRCGSSEMVSARPGRTTRGRGTRSCSSSTARQHSTRASPRLRPPRPRPAHRSRPHIPSRPGPPAGEWKGAASCATPAGAAAARAAPADGPPAGGTAPGSLHQPGRAHATPLPTAALYPYTAPRLPPPRPPPPTEPDSPAPPAAPAPDDTPAPAREWPSGEQPPASHLPGGKTGARTVPAGAAAGTPSRRPPEPEPLSRPGGWCSRPVLFPSRGSHARGCRRMRTCRPGR